MPLLHIKAIYKAVEASNQFPPGVEFKMILVVSAVRVKNGFIPLPCTIVSSVPDGCVLRMEVTEMNKA